MILPAATSVPPKILNSRRWNPYFKDCVRAIDGTHVLARVPTKDRVAFLGSTHDALILADALARDDSLRVPPGKFFLVDAGYAVRPGFLPPYRGTRYHLREFGTRSPKNPRELFNLRQSSLTVTVERAFGALKNRFKILYNKPFHPYKTQVKLVLACCILHNWILRHGMDELVPPEAEWQANPIDETVPTDIGMAEMENAGVEEGVEVNAGHGRLHWSNVMSGFVLRRFSDLVAEGVKTDKGFKDVHLNAMARDLTEFINIEINGNQVYNHLRKWHATWVKICRLKELSGALWDEENFMITLDPEHYNGHVKDHPKDAEFLNAPLLHYQQMQAIFASGVATGRFAMGSNEPLGQPTEHETIDVDEDTAVPVVKQQKGEPSGKKLGKRKRGFSEEDQSLMTGVTDAIWGFTAAVQESTHSEAAPGIYNDVMDCPNFTRTELMFCLDFLMQNKASALVFVGMTASDKELWLRTHLTANNFYG
ncbi:hypothetical protein U9M48_023460 [Paspalum notatum var. saurae]|uniref:Transposase n=1 Tax=Paspalum notatum var. saurae TaxID=547442 RepID=A0AAQ3TQM1_PASNO